MLSLSKHKLRTSGIKMRLPWAPFFDVVIDFTAQINNILARVSATTPVTMMIERNSVAEVVPESTGAPRPLAWFRRPIFAVSLIFALGFSLRAFHYDKSPRRDETSDEFAWTWSGMTLLKDHKPRAWSMLPVYGNVPWTDWKGHGYKFVSPWLDHPPLFSVVMGLWMRLMGAKTIDDASLHSMRACSLLFFIFNFWLLWRLAREFFDPAVVLVGLGIFAISPLAVLQQRLVISENLILLLYLVAHLSILRCEQTQQKRYLLPIAIAAVAFPLTKVAALGFSLFFLVALMFRPNYRLALLWSLATLLGLGLWIAYSRHFSATLFAAVMQAHRLRFNNFGGIFDLVFWHKYIDRRYLYPPFWFALISIFSGVNDKRTREFFLAYVIYVGCLTFMVDDRSVYGWYLMPMYPILALGAGMYVVRLFRQRGGYDLLVWSILVLPCTFSLVVDKYPARRNQLRYIFIASMILVPLALWVVRKRHRAFHYALASALVGVQLVTDLSDIWHH